VLTLDRFDLLILMKMLRRTITVLLCIVLTDITAQVRLTDDGSSGLPVCTVIELGTIITFIPSLSCGPDIAVEFDNPGSPVLVDGRPDERISLITENDLINNEFSVTFDRLGTYTFQCDVPALPDISGIAGVADQCFEVVEPAPSPTIPTIGEWGLIILGLLIMTIGVLVNRSSSRNNVRVQSINKYN